MPAPRVTRSPASGPTAGQTLVWLVLAAVSMLFVAFTSSYLIQRAQPTWVEIPLPGLLWWTTAVIVASSGTLEWARRALGAGRAARGRLALAVTAALGVLFLLGQLGAWQELAAAGVFMRTNPHSAFFYLLTGVHGVHLLGGLAALGWAVAAAWLGGDTDRAGRVVGPAATYWHFLGALWIYLFVLLFLV